MTIRFAHVNLVARDWRRLATFYQEVFSCFPVPPERDLEGAWLDNATGLAGAHIRGLHLRLPGWEADGPTLEIFQYGASPAGAEGGGVSNPRPDAPGLGHLAFVVPCLDTTVERVLARGGGLVGETAEVLVGGAFPLRFRYVRDPEGNILEIQEGRDDGRYDERESKDEHP